MNLWLLAALALMAEPQQSGTQPPAQTFRSGTQAVQVDVRGTRDGRFVSDLGPGEFEVREDGLPQQIESVTLIAAPQALPGVQARLALQAPRAEALPQVWLFVFDTGHLSPGGLTRTRDAVA